MRAEETGGPASSLVQQTLCLHLETAFDTEKYLRMVPSFTNSLCKQGSLGSGDSFVTFREVLSACLEIACRPMERSFPSKRYLLFVLS